MKKFVIAMGHDEICENAIYNYGVNENDDKRIVIKHGDNGINLDVKFRNKKRPVFSLDLTNSTYNISSKQGNTVLNITGNDMKSNNFGNHVDLPTVLNVYLADVLYTHDGKFDAANIFGCALYRFFQQDILIERVSSTNLDRINKTTCKCEYYDFFQPDVKNYSYSDRSYYDREKKRKVFPFSKLWEDFLKEHLLEKLAFKEELKEQYKDIFDFHMKSLTKMILKMENDPILNNIIDSFNTATNDAENDFENAIKFALKIIENTINAFNNALNNDLVLEAYYDNNKDKIMGYIMLTRLSSNYQYFIARHKDIHYIIIKENKEENTEYFKLISIFDFIDGKKVYRNNKIKNKDVIYFNTIEEVKKYIDR